MELEEEIIAQLQDLRDECAEIAETIEEHDPLTVYASLVQEEEFGMSKIFKKAATNSPYWDRLLNGDESSEAEFADEEVEIEDMRHAPRMIQTSLLV